ncbi:glycosyltransferase family 4 protein [Listeria monocytogenes]|nr:glycosyltransferase family 4 protein [Listeria monocytogenes]
MNYFSKSYFKKRTVIHNPMDLDKVPYSVNIERKKTIINTARLTPAKNQELLIRAFANIAGDFKDYNLEIYGDGPLKGKLLSLVAELNMDKRILLKEAIPNILNVIKDSEVFVLSSNNEGFPNSLAEAMAMGIPSISTNCRIGGPREMIDNYKNGFLVETNNSKELEVALRNLLSDSELRNNFSIEATKIRGKLDARKISSKWLSFFEQF